MTTPNARPTRVAADLLKAQWWVAAIAWGGLYLFFGTIGVIVAATAGLEQSVWVGACWWTQYLMMAAGVMVTVQHLRVYVAGGVTRRVFGRGAVLFGLAASAVFGAAMELGFVVERGIAWAAGAPMFSAAADFVASPANMLRSALEFGLLHAAYFFAGWVIAATFHRHGVIAGLAVIVPAMLPGLLMDLLKLGAEPTSYLLDELDVGVLTRFTLVAAVTAAIAGLILLAYRTTRAAAVKTP